MKAILNLLLMLAFAARAEDAPISREQRINALLEGKNPMAAELALRDWKAEGGESDPQYWVAGGNVWFQMALYVGGPAVQGGLKVDKADVRKAISFLDEGIRRNPQRLDIYTGRVYLYQALDDLDGELAALSSLVNDTMNIGVPLEVGPGKTLNASPAAYKAGILNDCARKHFELETKEGDKAGAKVAALLKRLYPGRVEGYNLLAAAAFFRHDWAGAKKELVLAVKQAPTDTVIRANLGRCLAELGDKKGAREQYQKVVILNKVPELVKKAKKWLEDNPPSPLD
jgi:tetratricopeptide (TPR) repeat protein